jgi:hypothetical protein
VLVSPLDEQRKEREQLRNAANVIPRPSVFPRPYLDRDFPSGDVEHLFVRRVIDLIQQEADG